MEVPHHRDFGESAVGAGVTFCIITGCDILEISLGRMRGWRVLTMLNIRKWFGRSYILVAYRLAY